MTQELVIWIAVAWLLLVALVLRECLDSLPAELKAKLRAKRWRRREAKRAQLRKFGWR
jgi:hypothetical protein